MRKGEVILLPEKFYNFCPNCGKKLPKLNIDKLNFCSFCGRKLNKSKTRKSCTICHERVITGPTKAIKCSFCGSMYHSTCVSSWLLKYNACPMCQNVFIFPNKTVSIKKY